MRYLSVICFVFSLHANGSESPTYNLGPNEETAVVAFYRVFFSPGADPTSFFNSEDPDERLTVDQFLEASAGQPVEAAIRSSVESVQSWEASRGSQVVSFLVPGGGEMSYFCHGHSYSHKAADNHCSACLRQGSITSIRISDDLNIQIRARCPDTQ